MLVESSFVHCGAVSRHLTTDETAEKGKTTTNALVVVLEVWMSTLRGLCKRHHEDEKKKGSASHDEEPSIDEFMN